MSLASLLDDVDLWTPSQIDNLHALSRKPQDDSLLTLLLERTSQLSVSLREQWHSFEPENRVASILKEHSSHIKSIQESQRDVKTRIELVNGSRRRIVYGEDIPLARERLAEYIIGRISETTSAAGLDVYKDQEDNKTVFTCGGKFLVLDMTFATPDSSTTGQPDAILILESLHVIHAPASESADSSAPSATAEAAEEHLPRLLSFIIRSIIHTCRASNSVLNGHLVARLLVQYRTHLEYLVFLDALSSESTLGVGWLRETGRLTEAAQKLAVAEAIACSTSQDDSAAALDVFLRRAHGLPLPHLVNPSLSFLVTLSPRGYLWLLKQRESKDDITSSEIPLDVSLEDIRHLVTSSLAHEKGFSPSETLFTTATMFLVRSPKSADQTLPEAGTSAKYPLLQNIPASDSVMEEALPESVGTLLGHELPLGPGLQWVLDIDSRVMREAVSTNGLQNKMAGRGIWVTQSTARAIARISVVETMSLDIVLGISTRINDPLGLGVNMGFGSHPMVPRYSWFDRMVDPNSPVAGVRYTAELSSTERPAIRATISPSTEPGFWLRRIPVKSMLQVEAILEILRDETWVDELLSSVPWKPFYGGIDNGYSDSAVNESDFEAILTGTYVMPFIPCTVQVTPSLFDPTNGLKVEDTHKQVQLVFPVPLSGAPLAHLIISHDPKNSLGIRVVLSIDGTKRSLWTEKVETGAQEFLRRGGGLRVIRWIWEQTKHNASQAE